MTLDTFLLLAAILAVGAFSLAVACKATGLYNFLAVLGVFGSLGAAGYVVVRAMIGG